MCKNVKYFFETLFCLSKNSRTFRKNGSRGLKTSVKGRDTLPKIIPRPDFAILRIFTTLSASGNGVLTVLRERNRVDMSIAGESEKTHDQTPIAF